MHRHWFKFESLQHTKCQQPLCYYSRTLLSVVGGAAATYLSPYEAELGPQPNLEKMEEFVVERKRRPAIKDRWKQHKVIPSTITDTEHRVFNAHNSIL